MTKKCSLCGYYNDYFYKEPYCEWWKCWTEADAPACEHFADEFGREKVGFYFE